MSKDSQEGFSAFYNDVAPHYDRRWSHYLERTIETTLAAVPQSGGRALDVGCGTGILLERLHGTGRYEQLVGIEPTDRMREQAVQRLGDGVEILAASAETLPFESGSFDLVFSTNMLHYCHPVEGVLEEMVRVLRPGGVLVLTDWSGDSPTMKALCLILRRFKGIQARAHAPHRLTELLRGMNAQLTGGERFRVFPWWLLFCNTYLLESNSQESALT